MGKKSVLFVNYGLGIGGIEKCFVNLLNNLDDQKYDIDILLMHPEYELKDQITAKVTFLDSFQYVMDTETTYREIQQRGGIIRNVTKFLRYAIFRICVKLGRGAWKTFKSLNKKYDIAIAYSQNDYSPYYVIDKVNADKKVMWYHNGAYSRTGKKFKRDKKYYQKFDYFVAVSTDCAEMLRKQFQFPKEQLVVLRNFYNVKEIINNANDFVPDSYSKDGFHIITVGRMTEEKGADLAVAACKLLLNKGYKVYWHWVGNGNQKNKVINMVHSQGMDENFILEGNQINPYPYIKCAGIYVQPSYYEAYSTTVAEAIILQKTIISTAVGGMHDQLDHYKNGYIVPIDAEQLSKKVEDIITNCELAARNSENDSFDQSWVMEEYENSVLQ